MRADNDKKNKKTSVTMTEDDYSVIQEKANIHIILNATSFVDGKLFDSYKTENIEAFCEHIQNVTGSACRYYYAGERSSDEA